MSAEESSFDSWIKFYRPDENYVNSQISYYDKGELLGLLLDLDIRRRTNNAKSLDDVMRYLYTEFFKKGRNYGPEDFQKTCELMAGTSLDQFFSRYVRGRDELPYNDFFAASGLRLDQGGESQGTVKGFLGAGVEDSGEFILVNSVRVGSPAYEQGLNAGDRIIALDGARVNKETFEALIAAKHPADTVRITVFRFDDLRTFDIKLSGRAAAPYRLGLMSERNEQQNRIYRSWLGGT